VPATLSELLTPRPRHEGAFDVEVPDGWQQGRGLFGGLVTGFFVRAFEAHRPGRPLRSLTAELCGPVQPGDATLTLDVLRDGNAVSTVTARLEQRGDVLAHAVGVLGAARAPGSDGVFVAPPALTPWRQLEPLPVEPPLGPEFARHWEYRTDSALPFSDAPRPVAEGWIRPKAPGSVRDAAFLAACVDAWWPASYAQAAAPRPMATIAFTFQPLGAFDGLDPDAPLAYRARVDALRDGYAVELRELWGEDGRLLALNQQTICLIA
jgi:acyl-CoA thioesterase